MTELEVRLRTPHSHQIAFLESKAKRKVIRAGRRGGKTVGIGILAVDSFLAGLRVLYATPTQEQVTTFWYEVKQALQSPVDHGIFVKNESTHTIENPHTRARIRAKTAWNADTLRGDFADILILDEFQLMNEDAWELVGAPMLLDNDGDAVFIYTPPSLRTSFTSKARNPRHAAELFKKAARDTSGRWETFHFTSHDNPYLSREALREIREDMTETAYRQEILAQDVDDAPGALWRREWINTFRVNKIPKPIATVIAVDPSASQNGDACGIMAVMLGEDRHYYILGDYTRQGLPGQWVQASLDAYDKHKANRIVYERNQGGDMVAALFRLSRPDIPISGVYASKSKQARAEPISVMQEKGVIHHVGDLSRLEDELCLWVPGSGESPNRLDAMVWGVSYLKKVHRQQAARVFR